ncbi:unnamed protein product [Closterium sp. Naga37s-1]|nr:unnamed protein product [Closterium sp. Naga37s-1]
MAGNMPVFSLPPFLPLPPSLLVHPNLSPPGGPGGGLFRGAVAGRWGGLWGAVCDAGWAQKSPQSPPVSSLSPDWQVIVRVRPPTRSELKEGSSEGKCVREVQPTSLVLVKPDKAGVAASRAGAGEREGTQLPGELFEFDHVAGESASQKDLFELAGRPITGSGKTYTMLGVAGGPGIDRGMIPRVFDLVFAQIALEKQQRTSEKLAFKCSFLEIYNETLRDLLDPTRNNLSISWIKEKGRGMCVHVNNLSSEEVTCFSDVMGRIQQGVKNRQTGETKMNRESSRSHCAFMFSIESTWTVAGEIKRRFGRLNLVDLAGSERPKKSGAEGEQFDEACNINESLLFLGNLINDLAEKRVPAYGNSLLTRLLRDSLGGNSKTTLVACISPALGSHQETLSTLRFAQRAKLVCNKAVVNESAVGQRDDLQREIAQLQGKLHRICEICTCGAHLLLEEGLGAVEGRGGEEEEVEGEEDQQEVSGLDAERRDVVSVKEQVSAMPQYVPGTGAVGAGGSSKNQPSFYTLSFPPCPTRRAFLRRLENRHIWQQSTKLLHPSLPSLPYLQESGINKGFETPLPTRGKATAGRGKAGGAEVADEEADVVDEGSDVAAREERMRKGEEVRRLTEERDELQRRVEELEEMVRVAERRAQEDALSLQEAARKLKEAQEEAAAGERARVNLVRQEEERMRETLAGQHEEEERMKATLVGMKATLAGQHEEEERMKATLVGMKATLAGQHEEEERVKATLVGMKATLVGQHEEEERVKATLVGMKATLAGQHEEEERMKATLVGMKATLAGQHEEEERMKATLVGMKATLAGQHEEEERMKATLAGLHEEEEQMREDLASLQEKMERATALEEVEQLRVEVAKQRSLADQALALSQEHAQLRQKGRGTDWRETGGVSVGVEWIDYDEEARLLQRLEGSAAEVPGGVGVPKGGGVVECAGESGVAVPF